MNGMSVLNDNFLEQSAERKHKGLYTLLYFLCWIVIVVFGFIGLFSIMNFIGFDEVGIRFNFILLIYGVVFGGIAFLLWRRADYCRMVYDYTFTNGTLDIAQVLNNKRRRYLTALDLKTVTRCGPAQGHAFKKALEESGVKKHNWFLNRDAHLYFFCFEKKGLKHLAVVELTDQMVALIRSKNYLQPGVWYDKDGKAEFKYGV